MNKLVALIGSEMEENLSLRYLSSSLRKEGFLPEIFVFYSARQNKELVQRLIEYNPLLVGISIPFQAKAKETLEISKLLRENGYKGHICIGGHFATFEFEEIFKNFPDIDSAILNEGEETLSEICNFIYYGKRTDSIKGLITRNGDNIIACEKRKLPDLDSLPFPDRPERAMNILGINSSPIVGSRGCYADCSFCCINAYHNSALGARYRKRSPENIVAEMKQEYLKRDVRLFVFNDDNFFVPSESKNIVRYKELHSLLKKEEMNDIGIVIKCRPNDVTPELFSLLKEIGMIRAYVGIESNSDEGLVSLNRRITAEDNRRAMNILRELDVYSSFNILIFDPNATLEGIERNLDFMYDFADVPFNFCRAEVYAGTPLKQILESEGRLWGNYLAWNYEMHSQEVELLFRISSIVFFNRNFKGDGVANLNMGIRFDNEVLKHFYPESRNTVFDSRLRTLSTDIGRDSVLQMRKIIDFVKTVRINDRDEIKSFTLSMARSISRADLKFISVMKKLRYEMENMLLSSKYRSNDLKNLPGWASETARINSSNGFSLSCEILPEPKSGVI